MKPKMQFHLLGWITLLVFPLPAWFVMHYFLGWELADFFGFEDLSLSMLFYGFNVGAYYALFLMLVSQFDLFNEVSKRQVKLIASLNLNCFDAVFISFCAAVSEELLFRVGIQYFLGPIWTSIFFVAIHGYFSFKNLKNNLQGLFILPFTFVLAFGYEEYGLWFSIAAHFFYDLLLFSSLSSNILFTRFLDFRNGKTK